MKKKNLTLSDFNNAIVWSYTRVSTKDQFVNNGSIETQVNRIKSFAKENNLIITKEFDAEYESSKRINTQSTLRELMESLKKTQAAKRPKMILIWSPSRFGRAGAEHIQLFVNLRKEFNVYLYSVSTDNHTFNERAENEFSTQLLYAQKENFSRQDTVIPGLINALENGKIFGRTPRGYDHYGPKVRIPQNVQAFQEIKINKEGELLKEAFKMKIYKSCTDVEIMEWLSSKGMKMKKQTISDMWRNIFYTGNIKNSLLEGKLIKGSWEPLITIKEFNQLQQILSTSKLVGTPRLNGKEQTPLIPQFLVCNDCDKRMTSYFNRTKNIYYYKCPKCNKTANPETYSRSKSKGIHDQFDEILNSLSFSKELHDLFTAQLTTLIEDDMANVTERKRILSREINEFKEAYDKMEFRYATNEISKDIFERQGKKINDEIELKTRDLDFIPSKKSNLDKVVKKFLKNSENPSKIYHSMDYNKKRKFQSLLFPEGLQYSSKKKQCLTSKRSILFDLTSCFSSNYEAKKERTQQQKALESVYVPGAGVEPARFPTGV